MTLDLVVLAGGRGARLGGVLKPLLRPPEGGTLLARHLDTLPGDAALVVAPEARQAPLRGALSGRARVRLVADPGDGPGWALLAAARASAAERLLVVGGDHVAPSVALAARLLRAAAGRDGAWATDAEGHPQPLFVALERQRLLAVAGEDPPRSPTRLLARLDLALVEHADLSPEERAALEDVDTPEHARRHRLRLPVDPA